VEQTDSSTQQDQTSSMPVSQHFDLAFDKYEYYAQSVQAPEADVDFILETFQEIFGRSPKVVREDFCGTFSFCCEWVKRSPDNQAIGLDIDPEPIEYGKAIYLEPLSDDEKSRVAIHQIDVLSSNLPRADVICALNFSYFIFKEREALKQYFRGCCESLNDQGLLVLDCFGGSKCYEANEEETIDEENHYSYFWDQDGFDPVSHHAQFFIHFQRDGEPKREKCFSYDWRLWSIPELRDILKEVGFKNVHVYWEGTDEEGEGDGQFSRVTTGEECQSWVAYVVAEK
jgi:hypothetical protein